ncbi:MAG TPA: signal recognition particle-docking protein FtsY [Planctomycetota bacterium]|nr:signal recognition particle-docking protein FtsY [Planctomycetota bacterium]
MTKGFFSKLVAGLSRTQQRFTSRVRELLGRKIDAETLDELEELLILSDMGVETTTRIIDDLRTAYREKRIEKGADFLALLKTDLKKSLEEKDNRLHMAPGGPTVIMVVGVNGTGKTTSIAKLSKRLSGEGRKVLLAASDTFRAAAVEQLEIWAGRVKVDVVKHQSGSDPAAVAFDAAEAALARKCDVLIVDTAGRLHTETNLMNELNKIQRVLGRKIAGAPHEVLLVLDATTGQNAIQQARTFAEHVTVTGLFLAKLDGTAKGGIVVAIRNQLDIPVKFIGVGEREDDIAVFEPGPFVEALFAADADETGRP